MVIAAHTPSTRVSLQRRTICVQNPEGETCRVPIEEVERVILGSRVSVTSACLARLLGTGIPVAIISTGGRYLGSFEPATPPRGLAKRLQMASSADLGTRLSIATSLLDSKFYNMRRALARLNQRRRQFDPQVLTQFKHLARDLTRAESIESLRGLEGAATARYYQQWATFLPPEFSFVRRSRRPPLNAVNAVISYTSSLVYGEILSACQARGLETAFAYLHETTDDRHSLPLDLMEPYRPCLIEPLALRMFSLGILNERHFQPHGQGIYLAPLGRQLLLEQYEDRLTRPFLNPATECRTTFRQLLRQCPLDLKIALANPACYSPFKMP
ncbi:MAG: CRISPR-associated endonuclease Cas1 [Akkermansiaceae bacterium]|nr:CRISPR-associated endonuclease Cas1 [Akkermansiaceae bacterium]